MTTVEFSFTVPILFLLVFSLIDFSRAYQLQAACDTAAIAAARTACIEGASTEDARETANEILSSFSIKDSKVSISPNSSEVEVLIEIPTNIENGVFLTGIFSKRTIKKQIVRSKSI